VTHLLEGYDAAEARGREVQIVWNGLPARAWLPTPLAAQHFDLGGRAVRLSEHALAAVRQAGNRSARFGPVATLLLRSEGVASSHIEGVRAPLAEVAAAEVGGTLSGSATYVADNLGAVVGALGSPGQPLSEEHLHVWHRRLMESGGQPPDRIVGAYRTEQSWIGGTSPRDAAFVPPPPEHVGALMADLVAFANDDTLDVVTQASVLHAQFVSIHPYDDGNGRIGRVLMGWVLSHRLGITVPPPVSTVIARDPGGYLAGLTLFRMGRLDNWIEWMATTLERSSKVATELMEGTEELRKEWRFRLAGVRSDSSTRRLLEEFIEQPVLSASVAADRMSLSVRAIQGALNTLAERGIVERYRPAHRGRGRPTQYWVARELVDLVAAPGGT
jgi:Fic family protein